MDQLYCFTILKHYPLSIRADRFICDEAGICTRNQLKQRLKSLRIDDKEAKPARKVGPGSSIELRLSPPPRIEVVPEEMELDVIFENADVLVLNKPQGLVVHPAPGNYTGTLVHGLLHYHDQETERDDYRPGIVHRLDKDTSGILITAKNDAAHHALAAQFQAKTTGKQYLALCRGELSSREGRIENRLGRSIRNRQRFTEVASGGKEARTRYRLIKTFSGVSFVSLYPETGRTHQLRVHMKELGHPILGDPLYGRGDADGCSLMLHAFCLKIILPGESSPRLFFARPPIRFAEQLQGLRANKG